ncbi:MAG TPA: DUF3604 domain-containing protein [Casimicrobiaceae bacterium]|nr:DUF3604 domain-containing protein [Casimicrobiaceae bacterium]
MSELAVRDAVPDERDAAAAIGFAYEGPSRMTAGELQRWTLHCTARMHPLPPGARIGVAHRWPSDWGIAQASDPAAADYFEAACSTGASVRWWNARLHLWHPFDHILFVELPDGLAAGASVALRYGEARHGSPGFRVQTFLEEASPFSLRWQADEGMPFVEFGRHAVQVIGAAPARVVITAPSFVTAGAAADVHVRLEDAWGNPASCVDAVAVDIGEGDGRARLAIPPSGWTRASHTFTEAGVHRLVARTLGSPALQATSNPVDVRTAAPLPLFWGDLHAQSVIGCGARSIDAYYAHARDFSATDFASHQANCFLVSRGEWDETQTSTRRHHRDGQFVTFLGVEWSGASSVGGDHNLYFPQDAAPLRRCSHEFVADKSDADTDLPHVQDVHRHYRGSDVLVAVHVGGRTADLAWHEPTLDRLLEVHSTHATSEWFLFDALRRGYRMGVIAGSDGVDGRPGNSHPGHLAVRNVRGGLTAIAAPALTRAAIWQALKKRHCYATTGERILLELSIGGARMGDAIVAPVDFAETGFALHVEGTAPLERIDFFRGTECLQSIDCFAAAGSPSNRVRVAWKGLSAPGNWQRARMTWDGELRVEGARIVRVDGWAFDTPDEGVRDHDATRVSWRSVTAGDWDGVVVEIDRPDDAEVSFVTGPMTLRTQFRELSAQPRCFDAAHPERTVQFRRLPQTMPPLHFTGRFIDDDPPPGAHAYWVRVRQGDGECAWSSPIFVDVAR